VAPSPDISIAAEKSSPSVTSPDNTLKTIAELRQELLNLKLIFAVLKGSSTELLSLSNAFEKRLSALQEQLKVAHLESTALSASLETLKKDFEAYREEVARNRLRDIIVAGGVCLAVGVGAGIALHHFLSGK